MPDAEPATELSYHRDRLREIFADRPWIVAMDVLAAAGGAVRDLRDLGASRCLCVAASRGTGPAPDPEFAPDPIVLDVHAATMMDAIRASQRALATLDAAACARVDAFDPAGDARVIGALYDDGSPVGGRAKYGARPPAWQALEDKTTVDHLWDALGAPRAPSAVVPVEARALDAAARALDEGAGTVWAGDSREGFNGGGEYVRWIRDARAAAEATAFFAARCDWARVMPFLDGVPCSIHGVVFPEASIALRPCEMLVLRRDDSARFHYARAATTWDPPPADREAMRDLARRTGELLRERFGYRGPFTIDGVMTARGFIPTELNPRSGAALWMLAAGFDLPLYLLLAAVVEGEPVDWRPQVLERLLLAHADTHRRCRGGGPLTSCQVEARRELTLCRDREADALRVASADDPPEVRVVLGPAAMGAILSVEVDAAAIPAGGSAAPLVARALNWLDARWTLGLGHLSPAPDVRRG